MKFLSDIVAHCQFGQIIDRVLARTSAGGEVAKTVTRAVGKNSLLARKMPSLFKGVKDPHIRYGYDSSGSPNSFFAEILDGQNVARTMKYNRGANGYNVAISGKGEHLNCVFDPNKSLWKPSRSALRAQTGVNGTPQDKLDVLVNLNDSALRAEGRVAKARLEGTYLLRAIPTKGRLNISSGVEGTPVGRTDFGLNYHGSDVNFELQNSHLSKAKNILCGTSKSTG